MIARRHGKTVYIEPCFVKATWTFKGSKFKIEGYRCDFHKDWMDKIVEAASKLARKISP